MPLLIIASAFWDEKGNISLEKNMNFKKDLVAVETST